MMATTHVPTVRGLVGLILTAGVVASCTEPTSRLDATGILLVEAGAQVQARPPNEAVGTAYGAAVQLAASSGDDLGYPWIDPTSGELVLSALTQRGRDLIQGASISVPHRIRDVAHGAGELRQIQDDVTSLGGRGVPGAELMYATLPAIGTTEP